jgi:hypothetical protein
MKLLSLLMLLCSFSAQAMLTPSTKSHVKQFSPGVHKDAEGFVYRQRGIEKRINTYDVDKQLRNVTPSQFKALSSHVLVHKMTNGEYAVRLNAKGLGGGPGGATAGFWFGKWVVHAVGHGAILIASAGAGVVGGPGAALWMGGTLEATFGPAIEGLSNVGALTGGLLGGVATGPA